jgi:hypothetical protein
MVQGQSCSQSNAAMSAVVISEPRACPNCKRRRAKCSVLGIRPCTSCAEDPDLMRECIADASLLKRACASCKSLKRYCDKQRPCSRCTEKGVQCIPSWLGPQHKKEDDHQSDSSSGNSPPCANFLDTTTGVVGTAASSPDRIKNESSSCSSHSKFSPKHFHHPGILSAHVPMQSLGLKTEQTSNAANLIIAEHQKIWSNCQPQDVHYVPSTPILVQVQKQLNLGNTQNQKEKNDSDLFIVDTVEKTRAHVRDTEEFLSLTVGLELEDRIGKLKPIIMSKKAKEIVAFNRHEAKRLCEEYSRTPPASRYIDRFTLQGDYHYLLEESPVFWDSEKIFEILMNFAHDTSPMLLCEALSMPQNSLKFFITAFCQFAPPTPALRFFTYILDVAMNSFSGVEFEAQKILRTKSFLMSGEYLCIADAIKDKDMNPAGLPPEVRNSPTFDSYDRKVMGELMVDYFKRWESEFPGSPIDVPGIVIHKKNQETGKTEASWSDYTELLAGNTLNEQIELLALRERRDRTWMNSHADKDFPNLLTTGTFW